MEKLCSKCRERPPRANQRYCRECHNEHMRVSRPAYCDLSVEEKKRSTARAYANVYQKRGKIKPSFCSICLSPNAQKHHDDYDKPLEVRWLCRKCHVELHRNDDAAVQWIMDRAAQIEKEELNASDPGPRNT